MDVVLFMLKTLLLIAVSFAFFFALAAGLGADLGANASADLAASQDGRGCEAVRLKNCVFLIF